MKKLGVICVVGIYLLILPGAVHALSEEGYKQLRVFTEVLRQVEESYVEEVSEKEILGGAIRGLLRPLDPHTVYLPPDVYRELKVESSGRFGGIGVEVTIKDNWLTVVAPVEGSPAALAGVKAGDQIVRVNGVSTKGVSLGDAVSIMRGSVGSRLTLTIMRKGKDHPFDVHLVRRVIKVPSVIVESLDDGYAYVKVSVFQERTATELGKKLKKLGDFKGLIIDLRNNPGGLLGQAIEMADLFLDHGVIVSTRSRGKEVARYDAKKLGSEPDYPIVILVNGGSASASEIFAGALKDYGKALLVGTQTFGKGSVQSVIELDDGSALKITVAKYYTPAGQSIQGFGIAPNVIVEPVEDEGVDNQKQEAIKIIKDEEQYDKALKGLRKHHR